MTIRVFSLKLIYFGLFLFCCINNAGTANFSELSTTTMEVPAANLLCTGGVFAEHYAVLELDDHALKKLDVLQEIVIRIGRIRVFVVVAIDQQSDERLSK